jgi:hypothetical protein
MLARGQESHQQKTGELLPMAKERRPSTLGLSARVVSNKLEARAGGPPLAYQVCRWRRRMYKTWNIVPAIHTVLGGGNLIQDFISGE